MTRTLSGLWAVLAALVMSATAWAGSPGLALVSQCDDDLDFVVSDFSARSEVIAGAAQAKLLSLVERGASKAQLTNAANAALARVSRLEDRCISVSNRLAQRCMVRLVNLDEPDLILQITEVDDDRDGAVAAIETTADVRRTAIQDALAAALAG